MAAMTTTLKKRLSELLTVGYARLGHVLPRKPYYDDDEGGDGESELRFETHPRFADQPVGAASDLTYLIQDHANVDDIAAEREQDLSKELQKELQNANEKRYEQSKASTPKPSPV